ncbi:MAG: energy-coupling factor transporter ATPase [Oscillospiraceae bacterium]|nr:energy-coupling factor transporter ATPase [Candidatus Limimonas egerieequi]
MDTEVILQFKDVYFTYDEETQGEEPHWAVNGVSLEIKKGDFVAVLGHNGSGKSTLAKLSNAILIPDKGQVLVEGIDTSDEERTMDVRSHVGMVFQNPDNQIVATIVEEDVAFGPENLGIEPAEIRRRVDDALKAVDMYDYRDKEPHKLSGGQKQRVAIAGIIAMQPDCIVLDESTAMLDPKGRREVMDTIRRLHDDLGMAVVYITHYMDEAALADRVIVMEKGDILFDGTPLEVFQNVEKLRSVGLDVPQSTELALELGLSDKVLTPSECADAIIRSFK